MNPSEGEGLSEANEVACNSVLIIGAGIGGMDCALDLANAGYLVYLVEKRPSIGGRYAQVYKVFPYDECSACILTPKMAEVGRHPNIVMLTLSQVEDVRGSAGNFVVRVRQEPRYVDEEKCTGCQNCVEVCPIEVPSEYNLGLGLRKAIYMDFPQQIPHVTMIDREHCIGCGMCEAACAVGAVDYHMEAKTMVLHVGSIVVATGFDEFDPTAKPEWGYGVYPNVITSLQYERLSHPSGPTESHIFRPSDGKEPQKIVFVNCCGARDAQIDSNFCNKVCCMFSMKGARSVRMHYPNAEIYICYIDIRAAGKLFENYYLSTLENHGIKFVRGRVSEITESPATHNLTVQLEDTEAGELTEISDVELVVLNCAFRPSFGTEKLTKMLNIELDEDGFVGELHPNHANIQTTVPGIYVLGVAHGPRDGTDVVVEAKAVASSCTSHLPVPIVEKKTLPPLLSMSAEPRVGVFVCQCGGVIGNVVDVKEVVESAKELPEVRYATDYLFMCSDPGQKMIKEAITEHNLNRVIVCSCTPTVHEKTFRECVRSVGLPEYYFEGPINIREQCSMVHSENPEEATKKAIDLMRGGVARVARLEVVPKRLIAVSPRVLVIGGGATGMSAALDLADKGFKVFLIEREDGLGGRLKKLYKLFPTGERAEDIINHIETHVRSYPNIVVMTDSEVTGLDGTIGNFTATVKTNDGEEALNIGAVIVAVGTREYEPNVNEYGYKKIDGVITLLELEHLLKDGELKEPGRVVFIQCVGPRMESPTGHLYCSRVCCNATLINCRSIKELFPKTKIYVLYMEDLRAYGRHMEELYKEASEELGVIFIRWRRDRPPTVDIDPATGKPLVRVYDTLGRFNLEIPADNIVLSTGLEPPQGLDKLCETLGIKRTVDGFVEEEHLKFKPVDTANPGVYTASSFPKDIADSINLGRAAASSAAIHLIRGEVELEMIKAIVDEEACVGCGLCEAACPYLAITMKEVDGKEVSTTDDVKCQGCGTCVAGCPVGARELRWWRDEAFIKQIEAILRHSR